MSMIPPASRIASMVSEVTQMMFGLSFTLTDRPWGDPPFSEPADSHVVLLGMPGSHPVQVLVACEPESGLALSSSLFGVEPDGVDPDMVTDGLGELANIIAGQVKIEMKLEQPLGLPEPVCEGSAYSKYKWSGATLSNEDANVKVWVAITETNA